MTSLDFTDRNVLVVGLGASGMALARFLKKRGADVTVSDAAPEERLAGHIPALKALGVRLDLGGHSPRAFEAADMIVISPGVPHTLAPLEAARRRGVPVTGELELASRFISAPVIAVTGTNGKTTVVTLLGRMLERSGLSTFVGGNIGDPLIGFADGAQDADVAVVEVSSFQLDTAETFRPRVSVLLNITDDHMDRYPDFNAYVLSKGTIFRNQQAGDTAVINGDDPHAVRISRTVSCTKRMYRSAKNDAAEADGTGATIYEDRIRIRRDGGPPAEIDLSAVRLPGRHNRENICAAALAALSCGGSLEGIGSALADFKGLSHRIEYVETINGVDYYNDSKATNADAVKRALECFSGPIILIMGGRDKGGDFSALTEPVRSNVKTLILLGEAADLLQGVFDGVAPIRKATGMADAVAKARALAAPGDAVLLSPGCASFDMYGGYAARGEDFRRAAKQEAGKAHGLQ